MRATRKNNKEKGGKEEGEKSQGADVSGRACIENLLAGLIHTRDPKKQEGTHRRPREERGVAGRKGQRNTGHRSLDKERKLGAGWGKG